MATAYIPGPSLQAKVQADGPFCPEELRSLTAGLAEGLTAIHASGLVHRDLKPRNILLASDGPRIIDFGVARPQSMDVTALTETGDLVGTPSFMSPEQIDSGKVGPSTDVFSLGARSTCGTAACGPCGPSWTKDTRSSRSRSHRTRHGSPSVTSDSASRCTTSSRDRWSDGGGAGARTPFPPWPSGRTGSDWRQRA
jgi:serine/threonine protein kinase